MKAVVESITAKVTIVEPPEYIVGHCGVKHKPGGMCRTSRADKEQGWNDGCWLVIETETGCLYARNRTKEEAELDVAKLTEESRQFDLLVKRLEPIIGELKDRVESESEEIGAPSKLAWEVVELLLDADERL